MVVIHLQRRHRPKCEAGHKPDSFTAEVEDRRRAAKKCSCPIFASGTLNGGFQRVSTRARDWDKARAAVEPYLDAGSWTIAPPAEPAPPPEPVPPPPSREEEPATPVAEGIERFLKMHEKEHTAESTVKKYTLHLKGRRKGESENKTLLAFAEEAGIRFVEEFRTADVRVLSESWDVGFGTRTNRLNTLKCFFEMFLSDGEKNPARFKRPRNRAQREDDNAPRIPFTDDELRRMLEGCRLFGKTKREWPKKKDGCQVVAISGFRDYARKWNGEDVALFIEISYYTGLRISDVATFHVSRLQADGTVRLRAEKNGSWICVHVPEFLRKKIRESAAKHGPYIFGDPRGRKPDNVTQTWRRRLELLWEGCGPWEEPPMHHRFRHTFVRILLQNRIAPSIVARLIGDTEETVIKHYANWVPELQEVTTALTKEAFENRPRYIS